MKNEELMLDTGCWMLDTGLCGCGYWIGEWPRRGRIFVKWKRKDFITLKTLRTLRTLRTLQTLLT